MLGSPLVPESTEKGTFEGKVESEDGSVGLSGKGKEGSEDDGTEAIFAKANRTYSFGNNRAIVIISFSRNHYKINKSSRNRPHKLIFYSFVRLASLRKA